MGNDECFRAAFHAGYTLYTSGSHIPLVLSAILLHSVVNYFFDIGNYKHL